jgi:ankyrin repeat protein
VKGVDTSIKDTKRRRAFDFKQAKELVSIPIEQYAEIVGFLAKNDCNGLKKHEKNLREFIENETGNTILHECVIFDADSCLSYCLDLFEKRDPSNKSQETSIDLALKLRKDKCLTVFLIHVIDNGNLEEAAFLINNHKAKITKIYDCSKIVGIDTKCLNEQILMMHDKNGESILYAAVKEKNVQYVKRLIDMKCELSYEGKTGNVFHLLAANNDKESFEILNYIIDKRHMSLINKINAEDANGNFPLNIAFEKNNINAFKLLMEKNAMFNRDNDKFKKLRFILCTSDEYFPFLEAIINNLDNNFGIDEVDPETKKTMMTMACENFCTKTIGLLARCGAIIKDTTILHRLASNENYNPILSEVLKNHHFNGNIDVENDDGYTALQCAALGKNIEGINYLVKAGANLLKAIHLPGLESFIKDHLIQLNSEKMKEKKKTRK